MLKATLELSDINTTRATQRAYSLNDDREKALRQARHALQQAREAKEEGGFFRQVASEFQTVAVVASVVATAATAGAGAPTLVAALALTSAACSAGSYAMKRTGFDGTLCSIDLGGTKLDLKWSDAVMLAGLGAGVGSACASAAAKTAAEEAGKRAAHEAVRQGAKKSAEEAGQEACRAASEAAAKNVFAEVCQVVRGAALITQGGATTCQAAFTIQAGCAQARGLEHDADALEHKSLGDQKQVELEDQIDALRSAMELRTKAAKTAATMLEAKHAAMAAIFRRA
jgi:hypothetical protein